ncbi:MAG: tRNA (N(6)-L-threonylcarbamoyladenosine(37)-C(2))-methylthiotransferase MtaB [Oscillospiraceae bacterium]
MKIKFITLGCKTNIYESEAMAELFRKRGHEMVENDEIADVCVINTCTVTGTGAQKSRQQIRRARNKNPNAIIAVTGCFAQTEPESVREIEGVDIIIGNKYRSQIVTLVENATKGLKTDRIENILVEHEYEELGSTNSQSRIRANIKIEDGCNNFCTYCIIPYARGPVRSRLIKNIYAEAKNLAKSGFKEVVLTGIHIGSYGRDLKEEITLIDVIESIHDIEGIERIRLGSIEPVLITSEYVKRAEKLSKLCPQYHLSLQSGCNETLKRMNRHYSAEEYMTACELLKSHIKDVAITTDLMVGFPGETDEEFNESYEFCRRIGFSQMHIFKYSVRTGTVAEKMPNQVSEHLKDERSRKMLALAEKMKADFYDTHTGTRMPVLIEARQKNGKYHATTPNYMDVYIDCDTDMCGKIVEVTIGEDKIC